MNLAVHGLTGVVKSGDEAIPSITTPTIWWVAAIM